MKKIPPTPGRVALVGAGPGHPELITVRGLRLLQEADVILYDRLVHPACLDASRSDAELIFVGKAPGNQMLSQEGIHVLLIERARQGYLVVRLKGGDPFVFGRGGEEALALKEAGIPYEIVPGVSSSVSVPAYAGIPVTHRGVTRGFSVVTGHTQNPDDPVPDWASLLHQGTLVVLMGLQNLPKIVAALLAGGHDPHTPAAVIEKGATAEQRVVEAPLGSIARLTDHLKPPATIVFGDVVTLRRQLEWFEPTAIPDGAFTDLPLFPNWIINPTIISQ